MTFEEMLNDPEMFVPHHLLEIVYSSDELVQMNRYNIVPANELIWVRDSTHRSNNVIHVGIKDKEEWKRKISKRLTGIKRTPEQIEVYKSILKSIGHYSNKGITYSEFGDKFKDHYGKSFSEAPKLYQKEYRFYLKHKKCSWE